MTLFTDLPSGLDEVDLIIVGGGTAGLVVASRLSDADADLSVLVIEGGKNNHNDPEVLHPVFFLSHMLPSSKRTLFYKGTKEGRLDDREMVVPSGGILGGGSSINLMTYSRPQRDDWDSWKTPGWSADDMIPYLKKFETYHGPGSQETHGDSGPIEVSRGPYTGGSRAEEEFIQAAAQMGWPEVPDIMNLESNNAVCRNLKYTSPDGRRQDSAHQYLHPRLADGRHPNLHVLLEHQVTRILFEGKRTVGVEFKSNPTHREGCNRGIQAIRVKKMVVVSAGTLGTPQILERSGVGDPGVLARAGVSPVAGVPGVGCNYQDHHLVVYPYKSSLEPGETLDALYGGRLDIPKLLETNDKILGWTACDVTSKLRPSKSDVATLGPAFQAAWDKDFKNKPNRPVAILTPVNTYPADPTGMAPAQFQSLSAFTVYPYSRGHIHITGPEISDPIDFETGFLSDPDDIDIKMSLWAYKKQREILRRMEVYRGEWAPGHPPFPVTSLAASVEVDRAVQDVKDIEYSPEDDAIIEQWLRKNVGTTWHSMGTCKMAPREEKGVVDPSLNVYGVKGLKIADLSIVPENLAANTAGTAFAIGEKAADIFIKELGLGQ